MPDGNPNSGDLGEQLFARFAGALTGKLLGDVPDADKVSLLDDLVSCLDELASINRYFAVNIFDKFGDKAAAEQEGVFELSRKPDLRDFLVAWTSATIRFLDEEEERDGGGGDDGGEDGEPPDDGGEADPGEGGPGPGRVIDADFTVKTGKKA